MPNSISVSSLYIITGSLAGRPRFNPRSRHTKDFEMVLDISCLNTQQYKVRIKGKVEQFRERSGAFLDNSV